MEFWVIILGIVQGITEFLPISSTAHLILIPYLFKVPDFGLTFNVGLHLGTFLAVFLYFIKDWIEFLIAIFKGGEKRKILGLIILATIPAGIFGILLDPFVEKISEPQTYPFAIWIILVGVVVFGIIFLLLERYKSKPLELKDLDIKKAIIIGVWQVFALFPGVSRSGSSISGGMYVGLRRDEATKFSFYMSLPLIGGAVFFKFIDLFKGNQTGEFTYILYGALVSFVVGIFSIHILLNYVKKSSLKVFSYYRFILAFSLLLAFFSLHILSILVFTADVIYLLGNFYRPKKEAI
uniref:Undecaprenyl-diphosphatase n=1 Tax=Dictyoglomus thermophilum TaxID=14 RepID=A0A7C3MPL8_DICTH